MTATPTTPNRKHNGVVKIPDDATEASGSTAALTRPWPRVQIIPDQNGWFSASIVPHFWIEAQKTGN